MLFQPARREDCFRLLVVCQGTTTLASGPVDLCPVAMLGAGFRLCPGCLPAASRDGPSARGLFPLPVKI